MHKIKTRLLIFLIITLGVFCIVKISELKELEERENRLKEFKNSVDDFAKKIKNHSFSYLKSKKKLFAKKDDLKKSIEKISRKLSVEKISLKSFAAFEEIRIFASQENEIYKFIEEALFEIPGIIQFVSITFSPTDKEDVCAIIKFRVFEFSDCPGIISISPTSRNRGSIDLFGKKKTHNLFCTIDNSRAYIDGSWFQIGDRIDDCELTSVAQNFIELQKEDSSKIQIKLGASW
jgi:hypothetical protein